MRKFKLTNAKGETWDLQDKNTVVFASPEGLGWTDATEFVKAGSNYEPLELSWEQREISGSLFFLKNPYTTYFAFTRFASKTPLILSYTTVSGSTYNIKCRISSIEKTEITEYKCLECPVTFTALGLFYKTTAVYNAGESEGGGKVYDYTYPYTYTDFVPETVRIESDSMEQSPCRIWIYGPCTDPVWRHYVDGELIASGSMEGEIPEDRVLVIDSTSVPYSITEQDLQGNLTADRYQACDFGTDRFFFLRYGANTISIAHTETGIVPIRVEANISYASV